MAKKKTTKKKSAKRRTKKTPARPTITDPKTHKAATLRFPIPLLDWIDRHAYDQGFSRQNLIMLILASYREGVALAEADDPKLFEDSRRAMTNAAVDAIVGSLPADKLRKSITGNVGRNK